MEEGTRMDIELYIYRYFTMDTKACSRAFNISVLETLDRTESSPGWTTIGPAWTGFSPGWTGISPTSDTKMLEIKNFFNAQNSRFR